jgi:uncharacterized protein
MLHVMNWVDYGVIVTMGLLGSAHCVGMCSPFALAISVGRSGGTVRLGLLFARHLAYQLGKATAYVFIGVLILLTMGWVDGAVASSTSPLAEAQQWLGWGAGGVLVLIGLSYLFAWRWSAGAVGGSSWTGRACGALRALWSAPSLWRCVLIGWINGFLPCGLSLAALLYLASRDSFEGMIAGAYVFGFSTLPGLFVLGWLGSKASPQLRSYGLRAVGLLLIAAGALTIFRGHAGVHHWFHEHMIPHLTPAQGHELHH